MNLATDGGLAAMDDMLLLCAFGRLLLLLIATNVTFSACPLFHALTPLSNAFYFALVSRQGSAHSNMIVA